MWGGVPNSTFCVKVPRMSNNVFSLHFEQKKWYKSNFLVCFSFISSLTVRRNDAFPQATFLTFAQKPEVALVASNGTFALKIRRKWVTRSHLTQTRHIFSTKNNQISLIPTLFCQYWSYLCSHVCFRDLKKKFRAIQQRQSAAQRKITKAFPLSWNQRRS